MIKKIKQNIPAEYHNKLLLFVIIVALILLLGIIGRVRSENELNRRTQKQAIPAVAVIKANSGKAKQEIVLPGNVVAWHEATIFARTNGYIKKWLVDIGTRVKKGELLALIETPEVDAQLRQAEADLNTAIANYNIAQSTSLRWQNLLKTNSVSKQETNEKVSSALSLKATMNSFRAKRDMLKDLVGFKEVVAPFDGIISSRSTDIGALISEGSTSTTTPLFTIVQADKLRIYVNVPQNYSSRITPDIIVNLTFHEHPGKSYTAKLLKTAKAIDATTRTLLTEFIVDNKNYELLPGGYTQVHITLPTLPGSVVIPVNTLIFRAQGLQIATVGKDNKVILKSVKITRDFGTEVEIDSGVPIGETIILNPPDSLATGTLVEVVSSKEDKGKTS